MVSDSLKLKENHEVTVKSASEGDPPVVINLDDEAEPATKRIKKDVTVTSAVSDSNEIVNKPTTAASSSSSSSVAVTTAATALVPSTSMSTTVNTTSNSEIMTFTSGTGPMSIWEGWNQNQQSLLNFQQSSSPSHLLSSPNFRAKAWLEKSQTQNVKSGPLPFQVLTDALTLIEDQIGSGKGSNKYKVLVLANLFRLLMFINRGEDLICAVWFLLSKVAPDYEGIESGVGDQLVIKAVATALASSASALNEMIARGDAQDLGEAALLLKMKTTQLMTPARLTIAGVFDTLKNKIAKIEGKDSQKLKLNAMQKLIASAQRDEVKYVVRGFQAKLRVGINNATILTSLAHAYVFSKVDQDEKAFSNCDNGSGFQVLGKGLEVKSSSSSGFQVLGKGLEVKSSSSSSSSGSGNTVSGANTSSSTIPGPSNQTQTQSYTGTASTTDTSHSETSWAVYSDKIKAQKEEKQKQERQQKIEQQKLLLIQKKAQQQGTGTKPVFGTVVSNKAITKPAFGVTAKPVIGTPVGVKTRSSQVKPVAVSNPTNGKATSGVVSSTNTTAIATTTSSTITPKTYKYLPLPKTNDPNVLLEHHLYHFEQAVKRSYCEQPNYNKIVQCLTQQTSSQSQQSMTALLLNRVCRITPTIPLKPMLAKPTKGVGEVLERLNGISFTMEYKYDGERAQIHIIRGGGGSGANANVSSSKTTMQTGSKVGLGCLNGLGIKPQALEPPLQYRIYSRNSENMTQKYPDLVEIIKKNLKPTVTSLIIDSEVVAYDLESKTIQPFQKLSTRSKKNVTIDNIKVQVCLFVFDLIYLNGKAYAGKPLRERRKALLNDVLEYDEGRLHFAEGRDVNVVTLEDGSTVMKLEQAFDTGKQGKSQEGEKGKKEVEEVQTKDVDGDVTIKDQTSDETDKTESGPASTSTVTLASDTSATNTISTPKTMSDKQQLHDTSSIDEQIATYLNEAVQGSCEGLMLKTLDTNASYEPSKRSLNWLKLKKDYLESTGAKDGGGLGDTVDLVPIAAWYGSGKRTGTFGSFLLACYNPETDEYESLCKAGTGYSDEDLKQHYEFFKNKTLSRPDGGNVLWKQTPTNSPDVWLEICQVWEIKAADLSISPVHCAAMGLSGIPDKANDRGIALRFPRFLRIRDDKKPEDATNSQQIKDMYMNQSSVNSGGLGGFGEGDGEDDFL